MATPFLGFENDVENTLQPGVAFNQLADDMDAAMAGNVTVNFTTDANLTLTRPQWMTAVLVLTDTGPVLTGGVDVIFPAAFPAVLVVNDTAQTLTLSNGDTDEVTLEAGSAVRIVAGPDGVLAVESGGGGGFDVLDVSTPSNVAGTVTLDFAGKSRYAGAITLAANVTTLAFSNLPGAGKFAEYELHIKQDGTGSRTFAIPASHKALGGSDTAIASAANAVTVLTASTVDNGTTWRYAMQESA